MNSYKILTILYVLGIIFLGSAVIITHVLGKMRDDKKMLESSDTYKIILQLFMALRIVVVLWGAAFGNKN